MKLKKQYAELIANRKFMDASNLIVKERNKKPDDLECNILLADILVHTKKWDKAIELLGALEQAYKKNKQQLPAFLKIRRAEVFKSKGDNELAEQELRSIDISSIDIEEGAKVNAVLAMVKVQLKELEAASAFANKAISLEPNSQYSRYSKALVHIENREYEDGLTLLETNLEERSFYSDSIDLWLNTLEKLERSRYAQDVLEKLAEKHPDMLEFSYGIAVNAHRSGEIPTARKYFQICREKAPLNARILYEYGVIEKIGGNLELAEELVLKSLDLNPDQPGALRVLGQDKKFEYGDENYKRLNYVAAKFSEFSDNDQVQLHFALAKAAESVDDLDTAYRHWEVGGRKRKVLYPYQETEALQMSQMLPKVVTKERLLATNDKGSDTDVPVFILGMPRSGTTLMEQVLSAHPDIFGAGELKFMGGVVENIQYGPNRIRIGEKEPVFKYEDEIGWAPRGDAFAERLIRIADGDNYKRIVDKMPGNYNYVGFIRAIMPNAKIIHSRRHPVETCLSIYRILFSEGHQWSYDLKDLARYYRSYWNTMEHWRTEFPGEFLEIKYEENVHNLESQAKKLIDYLDLPWNEKCLEFYNVDRAVKTASLAQVRKPIYKSSTNRWKKYEKYLTPLLEEMPDIIEAYEAEIKHIR
ncbi:sulfotransferase [Rhodobacteraceae bacterium]|nr:sulfotransferase [Paracoccaceae bacterium]